MSHAFVEKVRLLEWMETDAAGHQHYTSAFRWVEECESALYRKLGLPTSLFGQIPRVKVQMEYKKRIFFGVEILTRLEVVRVGTSSIELAFTLTSEANSQLTEHTFWFIRQSLVKALSPGQLIGRKLS